MPQVKVAMNDYEIISKNAKPDLAGNFGGVRVQKLPDGRQVVRMAATQAKWYLDQGAIKLYSPRQN